MFLHTHPYGPFLFEGVEKLIVGTLPPPRFSMGELRPGDVDFCYGSRDGQLWPVLDRIFNLDLIFETSAKAVQQRKDFLISRRIGICDIVHSAEREKIDATDLGMRNVSLRPLFRYIEAFPTVHTLLFTGGNSKNGPEYFFRKLLKKHNSSLEVVSDTVPRIHQFKLPLQERNSQKESPLQRTLKTVSLTAPSGSANRAVGSLPAYKKLKNKNPKFNTLDFRIMQYRNFF